MIAREILVRLSAETGALLGELGVRASDRKWIDAHAESIASLGRVDRRRGPWTAALYRWARRAARIAR